MKINLHATYRIATGAKTVELGWVENMDVDMAVRKLVEQFPQLRSALLDEQDGLSESVHLFVNRKDITHAPEGARLRLREGDVIDLFPPISGGKLLF